MNAYAVFLTLQGIGVAFRYDDIRETKFLSLGNSLFYATYRTNLAAQSHLTAHAPAFLYRDVHVA